MPPSFDQRLTNDIREKTFANPLNGQVYQSGPVAGSGGGKHRKKWLTSTSADLPRARAERRCRGLAGLTRPLRRMRRERRGRAPAGGNAISPEQEQIIS